MNNGGGKKQTGYYRQRCVPTRDQNLSVTVITVLVISDWCTPRVMQNRTEGWQSNKYQNSHYRWRNKALIVACWPLVKFSMDKMVEDNKTC